MKQRRALLTVCVVLTSLLPACAQPKVAAREELSGAIAVGADFAITDDHLKQAGLVEDFQAEYPNVEVKIVSQRYWTSRADLLRALRDGLDTPDVLVLSSWDEASLVEQGHLLDLTPYIQPHIESLVDFDYEMFECWQDGKYTCVPWNAAPVVLFYRRDVFEAAGLPTDPEAVGATIATWDDFYEVCTTIKRETGNYCFAHNKDITNARIYIAALWQRGLGYCDPDTLEVTVDSPENVATLEMLGRFWKEDLVSDTPEWFSESGSAKWHNELGSLDQPVATLIGSPGLMDGFARRRIESDTTGRRGVIRLPAFEAGGPRAAGAGDRWYGSWVSAISKRSQNPDAAWAFIEFVTMREESQRKMLTINGFIPTLKSAYEDPLFLEGDPFYAGQNVRQLYAEANSGIPRTCFQLPGVQFASAMTKAIHQFADGKLAAEEALQEAAAEIRAKLESVENQE